jgi:hypothetical protein
MIEVVIDQRQRSIGSFEVGRVLARAMARRQATGLTASSTELVDDLPAHRLTSSFVNRIQRLYDILTEAKRGYRALPRPGVT